MTSTSAADLVAAADQALRVAEARIAEANADLATRASAVTQSRLVAMTWSAAMQARETTDRCQIARALPVAILPLPVTFLGFVFFPVTAPRESGRAGRRRWPDRDGWP